MPGRVFGIFAALSLVASTVHASTLHVPADYATIQAGVDAASSGDTVLVAAGTYSDFQTRQFVGGGPFPASAVVFLKQGVALVSESGPEATVIDMAGQGDGLVVSCLMAYSQPGPAFLVRPNNDPPRRSRGDVADSHRDDPEGVGAGGATVRHAGDGGPSPWPWVELRRAESLQQRGGGERRGELDTSSARATPAQ